jgi:hypothetical protein
MAPIRFDIGNITERIKRLKKSYAKIYEAAAVRRSRNTHGHASSRPAWRDKKLNKSLILESWRPARTYTNKAYLDLVQAVLDLSRTVNDRQSQSNVLAFVAIVAGRHLEIQSQVDGGKQAVLEAALRTVGSRGCAKDFSKGCAIEFACNLDAAIELLKQPAAANGTVCELHFLQLENSLNQVFPARNPLGAVTDEAKRKEFVTDCCVGTGFALANW